MKTTPTRWVDAANEIGGEISGGYVIYWDDATQRWWQNSAEDLDYLADLLEDPDEDVRANAYGHWCAATPGEELGVCPRCDRLVPLGDSACPHGNQ
jgi:hypothetical protein